MPSMTLSSVSTMNGRFTAVMPTITAASVYMSWSGRSITPASPSSVFRRPREPNMTIQPAARTALPTNSGSTTSMTRALFQRDRVRASA